MPIIIDRYDERKALIFKEGVAISSNVVPLQRIPSRNIDLVLMNTVSTERKRRQITFNVGNELIFIFNIGILSLA